MIEGKDISKMEEKELREEYDSLVARIECVRMYDGRGKGIDVYICDRCQNTKFTQYKDKGVTPYIIHCDRCSGNMAHRKTIRLFQLPNKSIINSWVRPTFEQMMKMDIGTIEHVLKGGLVLEEEIK